MNIEVTRCADGCVCVRLGNQSFCLSEAECRELMAKLAAVKN